MVYQRIRDLREDMDKSQDEVANELKMYKTTYARYERGDVEIPLERAIILADYYNVSLDYIASRTNDKKGFNKSDLPSDELVLIKKFRSLSENGKARILERLEVIEEQEIEEKAKKREVI